MRRSSLWLAMMLLSACGGAGAKGEPDDDEDVTIGGADECVDDDGDGYGRNCKKGRDCDDDDESRHEDCDVCTAVAEGCVCEDDAEPVECELPKELADKVTLCKTGMRYCRDGFWTECEGIAVFELDP